MGLETERVLFLHGRVIEDLPDEVHPLVLKRLNAYNPKLRVKRILPLPGDGSFSIAERTASTRIALIAESYGETQTPGLVELAPDEGTVKSEGNEVLLYRTVLYLFVSARTLSGRNTFVTQTIFPGLCALIDEMRAAPGIAFSAHPVYFLDLALTKKPDSVRRTLMLFAAMGIGYVSLHSEDFNPAAVPLDLDGLMEAVGDAKTQVRPYYNINKADRTLIFTTTQFKTSGLLKADSSSANWSFNGSSEKFYWSEVLPVAVSAAHSNYRIDCDDVVAYLDQVKSEAEAAQAAANAANAKIGKKPKEVKMSDKFHRTVALFDYIEKLSEIQR